TSNTVDSSPSSGQLHEALPGTEVAATAGGSARSVPRVESTTVARSPTATIRHGERHGKLSIHGSAAPPGSASRSSGKPIRYSPGVAPSSRRLPASPRRRLPSLSRIQSPPARNSAGNAQPWPIGVGVPTGTSRREYSAYGG